MVVDKNFSHGNRQSVTRITAEDNTVTTINGQSFRGSIVIKNGVVISSNGQETPLDAQKITVEITGDVEKLEVVGDVSIDGNVESAVVTNGSLTAETIEVAMTTNGGISATRVGTATAVNGNVRSG